MPVVRETESQWETHDGRTLRATRTVRTPDTPRVRPARFYGLRPVKPRSVPTRPGHVTGAILALGDMQTGKRDGGDQGVANAASVLRQFGAMLRRSPVDEVAICWTGDHVEGAVSQGGALAARTVQDLTQQITAVRTLMRSALLMLRDLEVPTVTMAAVPGNHGEASRSGRGPTWTYSDSHDTDALAAVREGAIAHGDAWLQGVDWSIPGVAAPCARRHRGRCAERCACTPVLSRDDMLASWTTAGLRCIAHHGHMWSPGKVHDWWRGQGHHDPVAHAAGLLISGHLHHLDVSRDGDRYAVQAPACEAESTWYRLRTGSPGAPGGVVITVRDGRVESFVPIDA